MAAFSKMRGLFGAPMMGQGIGDGIAAEVARSASPDAAPAQMAATSPTYKSPSTGQLIAGTIGDALQNWAGGRGNYLPGLQRQREQAFEAQQYQQRQADDYAGWVRKREYEAAHPGPAQEDAFTVGLRHAGINPASPEGQQLYRQRAYTQASPAPNFVSDGAGGGRWVTPPAPGMGMGVPQMPVGKLTPLGGGATPQGARTFPVR